MLHKGPQLLRQESWGLYSEPRLLGFLLSLPPPPPQMSHWTLSHSSPSSHIWLVPFLFFFFFNFYLFMIVTQRERERERGRDIGRRRSRLHALGARRGIRSRVSRIAQAPNRCATQGSLVSAISVHGLIPNDCLPNLIIGVFLDLMNRLLSAGYNDLRKLMKREIGW